MRSNDEAWLKEIRKNSEKNKRVNSYKIKYNDEELTFNQGYDHSTDIYNPFFIRVYNSKGSYIMSGSGPTIEDSYNSLITSLIEYMTKSQNERDEANSKISKILGVIGVADEADDSRLYGSF